MAKSPTNKGELRLNAARRKCFFANLSQTANVAASARAAGVSSNAVYAERRRSHEFRAAWQDSLREGYARLEADLLAEALRPAGGKTSDSTLKSRAHSLRLRLALMNIHRSNVKNPVEQVPRGSNVALAVLKAQLVLKLTEMRNRAGIPLGEFEHRSGGAGDAAS